MKPRIYADTSVIGGCLDDEFRDASLRLFAAFARSDAVLVLSDLTLAELRYAPTQVREVLNRVPEHCTTLVQLSEEAISLAEEYITQGVVGTRMRVDAQHIALATIARVDVLVSWNFKHVVNLGRIRGYNAANLRLGYPVLEIRSPQEVLVDEESN